MTVSSVKEDSCPETLSAAWRPVAIWREVSPDLATEHKETERSHTRRSVDSPMSFPLLAADARVWCCYCSALPPRAPVAFPFLPCVPLALFFLGSWTTRAAGMPLSSRAHQHYGNSPGHTSNSDPRSPRGHPAPSHALWHFLIFLLAHPFHSLFSI